MVWSSRTNHCTTETAKQTKINPKCWTFWWNFCKLCHNWKNVLSLFSVNKRQICAQLCILCNETSPKTLRCLLTPCCLTANRQKRFPTVWHHFFGRDCGFAKINCAGRALMCFPVIKVSARVTHTHWVCEESPTMTHQFVDSEAGSISEPHLTRLEFNSETEFHLVNDRRGHNCLLKMITKEEKAQTTATQTVSRCAAFQENVQFLSKQQF